MGMVRNKILWSVLVFLSFDVIDSAYSMGLRSFVALPVEKEGVVIRLAFEQTKDNGTENLTTSMAYGLSSNQTLLLSLPYRISPAGDNRQGDLSALYRHMAWQQDKPSGTNRFGWLGGVVVPTENDRDAAIQAGFVFTHVKNRHEIDMDALYQSGSHHRLDRSRYDISWQYRLFPSEYPEWGVGQEFNSVLELNGRWVEGNNVTHQLTIGLQWIHQKLVMEGGIVQDINNHEETRVILSTRFHF